MLSFLMLPFGFIKILFGKIFWNKVVKKRRKKRSYWRASRCNPLKDKDVVFQNSGYPPCRRLRRLPEPLPPWASCYPPCRRLRRDVAGSAGGTKRYPPCRRLRSTTMTATPASVRYPPCRRLRRKRHGLHGLFPRYPPCRRLRSDWTPGVHEGISYPPCRRLRSQ